MKVIIIVLLIQLFNNVYISVGLYKAPFHSLTMFIAYRIRYNDDKIWYEIHSTSSSVSHLVSKSHDMYFLFIVLIVYEGHKVYFNFPPLLLHLLYEYNCKYFIFLFHLWDENLFFSKCYINFVSMNTSFPFSFALGMRRKWKWGLAMVMEKRLVRDRDGLERWE